MQALRTWACCRRRYCGTISLMLTNNLCHALLWEAAINHLLWHMRHWPTHAKRTAHLLTHVLALAEPLCSVQLHGLRQLARRVDARYWGPPFAEAS
jgi:hypothetical protein